MRNARKVAKALRLFGYKGTLLVTRRFGTLTNKRATILITGDCGSGTGPFKFLESTCFSLVKDHKVIVAFRRDLITKEVKTLCLRLRIGLVLLPHLPDSISALYLQIVGLLQSCQLFIINAASFPGHLHLISCGTPTIYYSHSIWHRAINVREKWTLRRFVDTYHRIVTVSQSAYNSLIRNYFTDSWASPAVSWIYNWIPDKYDPTKKSSNGKKVVLTVGTLTSYKNPEMWARVASRVLSTVGASEKVEFWWAGDGPLLARTQELSRRDRRIRLLGFVEDPSPLYSEATLYFQPSEFESFGLAICEAMMSGLPCIVSDCGGPSELVTNGVNGYVVQRTDEDGMVQCVLDLLEHKSIRTAMGTESRARYLQLFTERHWRISFDSMVADMLRKGS